MKFWKTDSDVIIWNCTLVFSKRKKRRRLLLFNNLHLYYSFRGRFLSHLRKGMESWVTNWWDTWQSNFFLNDILKKSILEKFIELEEIVVLKLSKERLFMNKYYVPNVSDLVICGCQPLSIWILCINSVCAWTLVYGRWLSVNFFEHGKHWK